MPEHYNRSEWGARAPRGRDRLDPLRVDGVALHWPGIVRPLTTVSAVMSALRGWQRLHMDTNKWSDIAYQIAVDQQGNTYGLRGLRYRSAANGDPDVNARYGAFLLVAAVGEQPTPALVRTVRARVAAHRNLFPESRHIVGHRDVRPEPTACPGDRIMSLIASGAFGHPHRRS
jgi:hypothetical protein